MFGGRESGGCRPEVYTLVLFAHQPASLFLRLFVMLNFYFFSTFCIPRGWKGWGGSRGGSVESPKLKWKTFKHVRFLTKNFSAYTSLINTICYLLKIR